MPDGHVHYARIDCKDCGKFVKWGKKPDKRDMQEKNKYTGGSAQKKEESIMSRGCIIETLYEMKTIWEI
jgi:hypothetical protein